MKLFIFDVQYLTLDYHHGGSCIIIADDLDDAIRQFNQYADDEFVQGTRYGNTTKPELMPDEIRDGIVYELGGNYPKNIIIHSDSGCC
jgi:hypothetical protein